MEAAQSAYEAKLPYEEVPNRICVGADTFRDRGSLGKWKERRYKTFF